MYLAREMTDNSKKLEKEFGEEALNLCPHAYNKIKNMIAQDDSLHIENYSIKRKQR